MLVYLAMLEDEGDKEDFRAVYERNYRLMYRVALGILKHQADAENAVHEAFMSLGEKFSKYKRLSGSDMTGLCVTIVKHKAIDILRERNHWSETRVEELVLCQWDEETEPEASCLKREGKQQERNALRETMRRLPEVFAQTLELKYYYGYSNREIAEIMDASVKTVAMRLYRGKLKLRELLEGKLEN
ncbi:MAG: RNA polymerase sigma factor [Butyrivibrio sp.]|nr:RNA polymerase sigma factor [Muribaculum sp.]MCM1551910.1 RNA polymerase sigma factor [Butyrivibrio sp.]